jgi:hypothetical protein
MIADERIAIRLKILEAQRNQLLKLIAQQLEELDRLPTFSPESEQEATGLMPQVRLT